MGLRCIVSAPTPIFLFFPPRRFLCVFSIFFKIEQGTRWHKCRFSVIMRTVTCTLKFPDGVILRARASASSPHDIVEFQYAGDTSRLKPFAQRGTLGFFEWYLQGCAANFNAEIEVSSEGDYG